MSLADEGGVVSEVSGENGSVRVRVLGPVDVVDGAGGVVPIGGVIPSRLLACLVAGGSSGVGVDALAEALWGDGERPVDAVASIRTYVARLRRVLGADALRTGSGRYLLARSVEVDAVEFVDGVERARRLSGSPTSADVWFRALELWRGPAFGVHAEVGMVAPEAVRLDELRAEATEAWFDARLAGGEGRELVADVDRAVADFPLREGLRAQRMTVLARAGRQAEALRAFQEFRADLTDIGLEPSQRLVELDQQIARGEVPRTGARRTLRGYELGERLGEGAFAVVYRAEQASVGRPVAVKQIRGSLADQPAFIRQFEAEAHLIARLEHPHIVPLYDFWREPGGAFLVMRYFNGGSLSDHLVDGPLPLETVVRVVSQVASALDAAHAAGVVHRDVKPANILLDRAADGSVGNAYLSDFGIAVEEAERLDPEAWLSQGSPAYAPPEQLERRAVGPPADVHALGVATFEALTGRLPFPTETTMAGLLRRQLGEPLPLVRLLVPTVPAAVDAVIQRATAKLPEDRYGSAGEFARDLVAAAGLDGDAVLVSLEDRNPYKGLRFFDEADAGDFVGRDRLIGRLLGSLAESSAVLVVGPSGSGKSSVVRAGLLPSLRQGGVAGSDRWFVTVMVPGVDPFAELTSALMRVAVDPPGDVQAVLESEANGLRRVLRRVVPDGRALLLVIDQFEELFTLADESRRQRFLDALVAAVRASEGGLRLVATLRADFYDRPLRYEAFAELVEASTVVVRPLAADELERVITEPARSVGCRFEPGLVAEIVAEVADQPGALPLLQYALTELWERRVSGVLTRDAYREIGGVSGALARRAEELLAESSVEEEVVVRRVFGRLVTLGEGVADTRRRVLRSELGDDGLTERVVARFGAARLLSFDRDPVSREPTVEVAHEALIREWPRLRVWLEEDRDGLRLLRHVTESAASWVAAGRPESEVYRGGRLEVAEGFASSHAAELTPVEAEFVAASVEAREREVAAEQERFDQQARSNKRLRRLLAGVGVALVLAMVAGLLAFDQRSQARESAAAAEASATAAETRRLIASSSSVVDENPEIALLLASEAYRREPGPAALAGLQRVLTSTDSYLGWLGSGTQYFGVSWVGDRVIGVSSSAVDVFDPATREKVQSIPFDAEVDPDDPPFVRSDSLLQWGNTGSPPIAFSEDGNMVAVARSSRGVALLNIADEEIAELEHTTTVTALALDATGARLAVGDLDRDIALYETEGEDETKGEDETTGTPLWSVEAYREKDFFDLPYTDGYDLSASAFVDLLKQVAPTYFGNGILDVLFTEGGSVASTSSGMVKVFSVDGSLVRSVVPMANLNLPNVGVARFPATPTHVDEVDGFLRSTGGVRISFLGAPGDPVDTLRLFTGRDDLGVLAVASQAVGSTTVSVLDSGRLAVTPDDPEQAGRVLESNPVPGPSDLALSPDGGVAAVANIDGISLTALDGQQLLARAVPKQGRSPRTSISFDGEALLFSSVTFPGPAFWVDLQKGTTVEVAPDPDGNTVNNIRWMTPNAVLSGVSTLSAWAFLGEELTPVRLPLLESGEAFSPDERLFVAGRSPRLDGNDTHELVFVSLPDGKRLGTLNLGPWIGDATINQSGFSVDGKRLLTSFSDGRAVVIDPETRKVIKKLGPDADGQGGISYLKFSADGRFLATRDAAGSIDLRDPDTYEILFPLQGGVTATERNGYGPYFSPDSRYLLTVREQRPRLWDLEARTAIGAFPNDENAAPDGTQGKDGLNLVTTLGEYAMVWNLKTEEWPEIACRAAGRNLTKAEWKQFGPVGEPYRATCEQWPALG